jgi:hypothetical protein
MLGQALRRTHEVSGTPAPGANVAGIAPGVTLATVAQESQENGDPAREAVATCQRLITAFKQVGADLDELLRRVQQ